MGKLKDLQKSIEQKLLPGHDPDFMIIGAQKSATTTLFYYLNRHPKLAGSWPKEMHFFSRHMYQGKNLEWYRKHFTSLKKNPLFFEASPNYMYLESVAQELKRNYPAIKLILILRNPISRAFSAWNMYREHFNKGNLYKRLPPLYPNGVNLMYKNLTDGRTSFPTFSECIKMECDLINQGELSGVNFLRRGLYYDQISTYLKYFNKDQLFILGMKDLVIDPKKSIQNILTFLHVDTSKKWEPPALKAKNKRSYSMKIEDADHDVLKEFYRVPNQKLKELLGYQINW